MILFNLNVVLCPSYDVVCILHMVQFWYCEDILLLLFCLQGCKMWCKLDSKYCSPQEIIFGTEQVDDLGKKSKGVECMYVFIGGQPSGEYFIHNLLSKFQCIVRLRPYRISNALYHYILLVGQLKCLFGISEFPNSLRIT